MKCLYRSLSSCLDVRSYRGVNHARFFSMYYHVDTCISRGLLAVLRADAMGLSVLDATLRACCDGPVTQAMQVAQVFSDDSMPIVPTVYCIIHAN